MGSFKANQLHRDVYENFNFHLCLCQVPDNYEATLFNVIQIMHKKTRSQMPTSGVGNLLIIMGRTNCALSL